MNTQAKIDVLEDVYKTGFADGLIAARDYFLERAGATIGAIGEAKFERMMQEGLDPKKCDPEAWFAAQVACTLGFMMRDCDKLYFEKRNSDSAVKVAAKIDALVRSGQW